MGYLGYTNPFYHVNRLRRGFALPLDRGGQALPLRLP